MVDGRDGNYEENQLDNSSPSLENEANPEGNSLETEKDKVEDDHFDDLSDLPHWNSELDGASSRDRLKKPLSPGKKALIVFSGAILLLLVVTGTYVLAFYSQVRETQRILLDDVSFEETYDVGQAFNENIVNIAMLGFDRGWNREAYGEYLFRPDMLAVFSINFDKDQISVVRIPRDSYVPIHGAGGFHDKINHSYYFGYRRGGENSHEEGLRNTINTVSHVLGDIPIHYFVSVDMYSVIELVDAMGGIYYEVEEEIIDKHWEIGRILVPEGPQIMDGKTFLRYLQYRDDRTSQDYGRIDRQMNLLKETFYYLREQGKITDIPATYRIYKDYVETNLSYTQVASLAYYARDIDMSDENLHFYTIKGNGQMKDGIWYQVIRQSERVRIINEVFGIDVDPWPQIILQDSPEYIEEQRLKELEEKWNMDRDSVIDENNEPVEMIDNSNLAGEEIEPGTVMVPAVWGKTLEEVRGLFESRGLKLGNILENNHAFIEKGLVIQSEPSTGSRVYPGTYVDIIISAGS